MYGRYRLSRRKQINEEFDRAWHKGSKLQTGSFSWLGVTSMAEVRLQEGESLENALRRFKRTVMTEDIIKDVKRHSYYLKPGERRRVKQALAQKRARKKLRKDSDQVAPRRGAAAKPDKLPNST
jgi:small subunit ribosomal protein S21